MKRGLRFILLFMVALVFVPFLPLYIELTMVRSWRVDRVGDTIEWGWKICTLNTFWSNYSYLRSEQEPAFWLTVNIALAFIYALLIVLGITWLLARRKRREEIASG